MLVESPENHRRSMRWPNLLPVLGLFNVFVAVTCSYIEIVEQQACYNNEFRLTCPSLEAHIAVFEAVFTPASATNLIVTNRTELMEGEEGFTCYECFFQLSYPHTSAEKYTTDKRIFAENRSVEMNLRAPVTHRCSGVNHCSFILNVDHDESRTWGPGIVYIKYACIEESRLTKHCNVEVGNDEGFVQSPGYPHFYVGNSTCRWFVSAGHGQTVQITLLDLSLRSTTDSFETDCVDKLIIRDPEDGGVLLSGCEQIDYPVIYESKGESMDIYIMANSRELFPKRGILFHYKALGCLTPHAPRGGYLAWRLGNEAHYMCCVGRRFPNGLRYHTLKCLNQNTWDSAVPPCLETKFKILDENGTWVGNRTEGGSPKQEPDMIVDIIIPILLIVGLLFGNAVIVYVILKHRKRKEQEISDDEFFTLTNGVELKNPNDHTSDGENHTNSV